MPKNVITCPHCKCATFRDRPTCVSCGKDISPPTPAETPTPLTRAGVIYLIRCGPYHKIGKTIRRELRYRQLEIQLPEKAELIHEITTSDVDIAEAHWHQFFAYHRKNGEWFALTEDDVNYFRRWTHIEITPPEPTAGLRPPPLDTVSQTS